MGNRVAITLRPGYNKFSCSIKLIAFTSAPNRRSGRYRNSTTFASFEKFAAHFSNPAFGVTEPKEVPFPVTGKRGRIII
jgi:hypothetical protein